MAEKTCPSCGADVPSEAKRCRECFHDFTEDAFKKPNNGPLILMGVLATMAVVGAVTLGAITSFPIDTRTQVNPESRYIITTTQYVSGLTTDRISFDEVAAVEHVVVGNGNFKIVAIKTDGNRLLISQAKRSQKGTAEAYATKMGKPFTEVDNTTGFFKDAERKALEQQQTAE